MSTTATDIALAADVIVQTRDVCGNERAAVQEWCCENQTEWSNDFYAKAADAANRIWESSQRAAGAKTLSAPERQAAFRALT